MKKVQVLKKVAALAISVLMIAGLFAIVPGTVLAESGDTIQFALQGDVANSVQVGDTGNTWYFDRALNPNPSGTYVDRRGGTFQVGDAAYIRRNGAGDVNLSGMDCFTMNLWIEDNGAWEEYKNEIQFNPEQVNTFAQVITPASNLAEAFKDVVPGKDNFVCVKLDGMDKSQLSSVVGMAVSVKACTNVTKDLHIAISDIVFKKLGEVNEVKIALQENEDNCVVFGGDKGNFSFFDRALNPNPTGTYTDHLGGVYNVNDAAYIRSTKTGRVDISLCDYLIMNLWVEDNGAWDEYKDNLRFYPEILGATYTQVQIPDENYAEAFKNVVPGMNNRIRISLKGADKIQLRTIDGVAVSVANCVNVTKNLHIRITDIVAKNLGPIDFRLQAHEAGAVAGGSGHSYFFDRVFNPNPTGEKYYDYLSSGPWDVVTDAYIRRNELGAVNLADCDYIAFNLWVEDNGAWDEYKNNLKFYPEIDGFHQVVIPAKNLSEAFKDVVPGTNNRVYVSLAGMDKSQLSGVIGIAFSVDACQNVTKNLHIRITDIIGDIARDNAEYLRLDGTLYNSVGPGEKYKFDEYVNAGQTYLFQRWHTGLTKNYVDMRRYDKLSFYVYIDDEDDVWSEYLAAFERGEAPITMKLQHPGAPGIVEFSNEKIYKAFKNVVPNKECKVELDIFDFNKSVLETVGLVHLVFNLETEEDLHIKIYNVYAEQSLKLAADDVAIIDDENSECPPAYCGITTQHVMVGTKSIVSTTHETEGWVAYAGFWGADNLSAKNIKEVTSNGTEGALRFWLYVDNYDDFATLTPGECRVQIGQSKDGKNGGPEGNYYVWTNWTTQVKKAGWTEIILPIAKASIAGTPDLTKIDTLYFKLNNGAPAMTLYIDNMRVSANEEPYGMAGDLNGDGNIDILDLIRLKKLIVEQVYDFEYEILNDGKLDAGDLATLRKVLLGVEDASVIRSDVPVQQAQVVTSSFQSVKKKIANVNVKSYGAVGDGKTDDTKAFSLALNDMMKTGGTIFVPSGYYKITKNLVIPYGVTLLGEFNAPTSENYKVGGSVLMACVPNTASGNDTPFITVSGNGSINGFSIWYPEQHFENGQPIEYPYTIGVSQPISTMIENILLVNSYNGISQIIDIPHYQHFVRNIYGTPLNIGYQAGAASDSDRQQNFNFSAKYWLNSGLDNIPDSSVLNNWLISSAIGFRLGDIDFHYVSDINIDGYRYGIEAYSLYGRIYNFSLTNCNVPLMITGVHGNGGQLTKGVISACGGNNPIGISVASSVKESFSMTDVSVQSTGTALKVAGTGNMTAQNCTFTSSGNQSAVVLVNNGSVALNDCTISGGKYSGEFSSDCNAVKLTNCATSGYATQEFLNNAGSRLTVETNKSIAAQSVDYSSIEQARAYQDKSPSSHNIIDLSNCGINENKNDIGGILQQAIDDVAMSGGGYVYIPAGDYRLETPVTVKSGVELVGKDDFFHYAISNCHLSMILTDYGKNNPLAAPLIMLQENSGIRGLSIVYDKVKESSLDNPYPYATTVKGAGANVYIVNTTIVGGWNLVDFASNRCDNHYIENFSFATMSTGISVGGNSKNGVVINAHSNPGQLWSTQYTGAWDNNKVINYVCDNVFAYRVGACENETFFMSLTYGAYRGIDITDGADVKFVGVGIDYSRMCLYATGNANILVIDPQFIGTSSTGSFASTPVVTDGAFTGKLQISNLVTWNVGDTVLRVYSGDVSVSGGFLRNNRTDKSCLVQDGGNVSLKGVIVTNYGDNVFETSKGTLVGYGNILPQGVTL